MATPATPTQQRLVRMEIERLKSLSDMEIDFGGPPLTAVMGTNCSGKTTVLHALACSYAPLPGSASSGYKFPQFFKPNTDSLWQGSKFTVVSSQSLAGVVEEARTEFAKAQDRWTPRYEKRQQRDVRMLMIKDSVPEVETFGLNTMVHYDKTDLIGAVNDDVRNAAGQILNKSYDQYHAVSYRHGNKKSIGVSADGLTYPALSMSSGEQRVFHILQLVFSAPKHSLLLIDEIDLFLHQDALSRLLLKLNEHCDAKKKQLVFTTHFPPVARMYHDISVKTLHRGGARTIVFDGYSHAAIKRITGVQEKPLSIFVEDDVSAAIVERVANELLVRPYLDVGSFGAAANAFGLAVGVFLSGRPLDDMLVVLDGDVSSGKSQRRERIGKVLTGTEPQREEERKRVGRCIRPLLAAVDGAGGRKSPERMLHAFLRDLSEDGLDEEDAHLLALSKEVVNFTDRHGLIGKIVEATGEQRQVALFKIVKLAARADGWNDYTKIVRKWLATKKAALNL